MAKQGHILKEYIKSTGISQEDFAFKLGYKQRQGLTYHFKSEILDNDLILKLKEIDAYNKFIQYVQDNYTDYPEILGINSNVKLIDYKY